MIFSDAIAIEHKIGFVWDREYTYFHQDSVPLKCPHPSDRLLKSQRGVMSHLGDIHTINNTM